MTRSPFASASFALFLSFAATTEAVRAQGGSAPPGTIYFTRGGLMNSMNGDGSGKTVLPAGVGGEPSRLLHGGKRWFLQFVRMTGSYPDGTFRFELFAIRGDGALIVQLTNQSDLEAFRSPRWSFNDSKISFSAGRWVGATMTDGGIHVLDIQFDGAGDVTGLAQPPGTPSIPCAIFTDSDGSHPEIWSHDWAPNGVNLVFARQSMTPAMRQLFIANITLPGGQPQLLSTSRPAGSPSWSPTGTKIVFTAAEFGGGIYTINTNGTGESRILRTSGNVDFLLYPSWSANGQHVLYQGNGFPTNDDRCDVYRASASGSQKTNLTSSLDTRYMSGFSAQPVGWR